VEELVVMEVCMFETVVARVLQCGKVSDQVTVNTEPVFHDGWGLSSLGIVGLRDLVDKLVMPIHKGFKVSRIP